MDGAGSMVASRRSNRPSDLEMVMVLYKMPKLGCIPNVVSYSILINGLCMKQEFVEASEVTLITISEGLRIPESTYAKVINGLFKIGKLEMYEKSLQSYDDLKR